MGNLIARLGIPAVTGFLVELYWTHKYKIHPDTPTQLGNLSNHLKVAVKEKIDARKQQLVNSI